MNYHQNIIYLPRIEHQKIYLEQMIKLNNCVTYIMKFEASANFYRKKPFYLKKIESDTFGDGVILGGLSIQPCIPLTSFSENLLL